MVTMPVNTKFIAAWKQRFTTTAIVAVNICNSGMGGNICNSGMGGNGLARAKKPIDHRRDNKQRNKQRDKRPSQTHRFTPDRPENHS